MRLIGVAEVGDICLRLLSVDHSEILKRIRSLACVSRIIIIKKKGIMFD